LGEIKPPLLGLFQLFQAASECNLPPVTGQEFESVVQCNRDGGMIPPVRIMHGNPELNLPVPFQSWTP
jgi:hypothetical protein